VGLLKFDSTNEKADEDPEQNRQSFEHLFSFRLVAICDGLDTVKDAIVLLLWGCWCGEECWNVIKTVGFCFCREFF